MTSGQWHVLSSWHNAWLAADAAGRARLRDELSRDAPELLDAADHLVADGRSLDGFLETPAFVLEANALAARYAAQPSVPRRLRRFASYRLPMAASIVALVLLSGFGGWLLRPVSYSPPAEGPLVRFALALPPGLDLLSSPVLSPDGQRLAFVVGTGGNSLLMVRDLGDLGALVIGGTDGAAFPFWSPDGRWIGYSAHGRLMKVASGGGSPVVIDGAVGNWGGAWSSAGVIVFQPAVRNAGLQRVPESGGRSAPASLLDDTAGDISQSQPVVLPDGRTIIYCLESATAARSGLYVTHLNGPPTMPGRRLGDCRASFVPAGDTAGYLLASTGSHIEARLVDLTRMQIGEARAIAVAPAAGRDGGPALFTATSDVIAFAVPATDPVAPIHIGIVVGWRRLLPRNDRGSDLNLGTATRTSLGPRRPVTPAYARRE